MARSPFGVEIVVSGDTQRHGWQLPPSPPHNPETEPAGAPSRAMGPPGMTHRPFAKHFPVGQGFPGVCCQVAVGCGGGGGVVVVGVDAGGGPFGGSPALEGSTRKGDVGAATSVVGGSVGAGVAAGVGCGSAIVVVIVCGARFADSSGASFGASGFAQATRETEKQRSDAKPRIFSLYP